MSKDIQNLTICCWGCMCVVRVCKVNEIPKFQMTVTLYWKVGEEHH